jgi:flagellar assembly factor FliW
MIKFSTSRFGDLEAEENKVINFTEGLVGLPDLKRFIIVDHKDTPIKWLQSIEDPDMAFIVASPDIITTEYSIDLDKKIRQYLQLENDNDLVVLVILRVSGEDVVANLLGPLVINARIMKGVQIIIERPSKIGINKQGIL